MGGCNKVAAVIVLCAMLSIFCMGAFALSSVTLSVVTLPEPTGMDPVGAKSIVLADGTPMEFWYPAEFSGQARRSGYRPDVADRSFRERLLFPLVQTGSRDNVPVRAGLHPVVLYLPGWGQTRSDNTALCEDLASHGYIVGALDDSRPSPTMDFSDEPSFLGTLRWANLKVELEARRTSHVLSLLERIGVADPAFAITSTIDFQRVSVVGYSFGGAVAAEMAITDSRVRSAVNLDGWTFGQAAQHGVGKPFMIIGTGAATVDSMDATLKPGRQAMAPAGFEGELDRLNSRQIMAGFERNGGYYVTIDGTVHESFCDVAILPRLRSVHGAIDGHRAQRIIIAYVNEFLGREFYGEASQLLAGVASRSGQPVRSRMDQAAELTTWIPPVSVRRNS